MQLLLFLIYNIFYFIYPLCLSNKKSRHKINIVELRSIINSPNRKMCLLFLCFVIVFMFVFLWMMVSQICKNKKATYSWLAAIRSNCCFFCGAVERNGSLRASASEPAVNSNYKKL